MNALQKKNLCTFGRETQHFFLFFLSVRFLFLIIWGCKTNTHTHTQKNSDLKLSQPEKPTNWFCLYGSKCPIGSADGSRTLSAAAAAAAAMFIHEIYLIVSVKFIMTGAYGRSPYNKTHSDHCCFLNHSGGEKNMQSILILYKHHQQDKYIRRHDLSCTKTTSHFIINGTFLVD